MVQPRRTSSWSNRPLPGPHVESRKRAVEGPRLQSIFLKPKTPRLTEPEGSAPCLRPRSPLLMELGPGRSTPPPPRSVPEFTAAEHVATFLSLKIKQQQPSILCLCYFQGCKCLESFSLSRAGPELPEIVTSLEAGWRENNRGKSHRTQKKVGWGGAPREQQGFCPQDSLPHSPEKPLEAEGTMLPPSPPGKGPLSRGAQARPPSRPAAHPHTTLGSPVHSLLPPNLHAGGDGLREARKAIAPHAKRTCRQKSPRSGGQTGDFALALPRTPARHAQCPVTRPTAGPHPRRARPGWLCNTQIFFKNVKFIKKERGFFPLLQCGLHARNSLDKTGVFMTCF